MQTALDKGTSQHAGPRLVKRSRLLMWDKITVRLTRWWRNSPDAVVDADAFVSELVLKNVLGD